MPSHPVKWYSSAMPGAPLLRNVAGDLIAVLDWCLVNGSATTAVQSIVVAGDVATVTFASAHTFQKHQIIEIAGVTGTLTALNSQWRATGVTSLALTFAATGIANGTAAGTITCKTPGVGWQKAFSGTNKAAYRSQDVTGTRFYLRVDDTGTTTATALGYESMTSVDSGTNSFFGNSSANNVQKSTSSTARKWFVVGDGRTFYWAVFSDGSNYYAGAFGDFTSFSSADFYACMLSCRGAGTSADIFNPDGGGTFAAARSFTGAVGQVGLAIQGSFGGSYPLQVNGGLIALGTHLLREGTSNWRGTSRGLFTLIPTQSTLPIGTILGPDEGFDGLAMIIGSSTGDSIGNRVAVNLIGPW